MLVKSRWRSGGAGQRVVEVVILTRALAARPDILEIPAVLGGDVV
jgi:hypothetical protein